VVLPTTHTRVAAIALTVARFAALPVQAKVRGPIVRSPHLRPVSETGRRRRGLRRRGLRHVLRAVGLGRDQGELVGALGVQADLALQARDDLVFGRTVVQRLADGMAEVDRVLDVAGESGLLQMRNEGLVGGGGGVCTACPEQGGESDRAADERGAGERLGESGAENDGLLLGLVWCWVVLAGNDSVGRRPWRMLNKFLAAAH
jgi:hypothetical protein